MQLDTTGKKLLVATAVLYVGVVIFVPFINVFFQVSHLQTTLGDTFRISCLSCTFDKYCVTPIAEGFAKFDAVGVCQAFRSGLGPFMEHLVDEDFLHAVSEVLHLDYSVYSTSHIILHISIHIGPI